MTLSQKTIKPIIITLSIVVPIIVAVLYLAPKNFEVGDEVYYLPLLNAILNGTTFFVLLAAFNAIRKKNIVLHKKLMLTALVLSVIFLLSYVTYHFLTESTSYGGEGILKTIYLIILFSHILLAIIVLPLVLISFSRALSEKFDKHKKIARITLPIWLYVTLTGVVVYLMISPYY